jgi:hypothetical protein
VSGGYNFSRVWAPSSFGEGTRRYTTPRSSVATSIQYSADLLYFFRPEKKLVPFLAAGLGVLDVTFRRTYDGTHSLSDETNPYLNVGVGLEYG